MNVVKIKSKLFAELDTHTLYEILRLRTNVFVVEQQCPYPELDGADTQALTRHVWAGDDVVAYARLTAEPDHWRVGRVCTAAHVRGQGLAATVLEETLRHTNGAEVVLHAQLRATGLYERFGFAIEGEPFDDDGIMHVPMRRS